ncbi:MAG: DUF2235 domain-containing protein [Mitsuaria chitosanitabida]|uniref:DUF2235 domain-containing protein n=1 Tax=Roseateles chitosanitabidus TaxID=65048 RepID=UPI001B1B5725|nr:DUF2235 domain-containing protein [Roseateles chitosanitabidus]MBO9685496.1 DUF2235 domain-containing protein [Roseateles chitosanitabidus]
MDDRNTPSNGKNICLFIDGTWNEKEAESPTNVARLFDAVDDVDREGKPQIKLYVQGVGTAPLVDAGNLSEADYAVLLSRHLGEDLPIDDNDFLQGLMGGAFGRGTEARIKALYAFLCQHYETGDQVFLFGFSRGAFAVRSLAGFVDKVGMLLSNHLDKVDEAYALYERGTDPAQSALEDFLRPLRGIQGYDDRPLPLHFLGVWDTVGSLGLPSRITRLTANFTEFHHHDLPPQVMHARHALALHEIRPDFEVVPWHPDPRLKQVWFPGAHSDVGGGYAEGEDGLSVVALRWMAQEAYDLGLRLSSKVAWWADRPRDEVVHSAMTGLYLLTSWPKPRDMLLHYERDLWRTHVFHDTTKTYLLQADKADYAFTFPHVNEALRLVDRLALGACACLMLSPSNDWLGFQFERPTHRWWRSVTLAELDASQARIETFIHSTGPADALEVEAFARALCIGELLDREGTIMSAAQQLSRRVDGFGTLAAPSPAHAANENARFDACADGLLRALRLMGFGGEASAHPALDLVRFHRDLLPSGAARTSTTAPPPQSTIGKI